jgi:hypothetical protein
VKHPSGDGEKHAGGTEDATWWSEIVIAATRSGYSAVRNCFFENTSNRELLPFFGVDQILLAQRGAEPGSPPRWANKIRSTPKKGSSSRLDVFWEKLKKTILLKILK